jgi:carbon-monoxide dehydrogenase medium subunit
MRRWEQYRTPEHLADALAILREPGGSAAIVAGGTDLLLDLQQERHPAVKTLVDVSRVGEMLKVSERAGWIEVGAAVPLNEIIRHPLVRANADCLVEASGLIGGPQVRNVATLGGNVAHALPAGDGTIALLALGSEALLAGMDGTGWQPLETLFNLPGKPSFDRAHDILVSFRFPAKRPDEASAFYRIMRPQGVAIAILNMAARIRFAADYTVLEAALAVGPAGPRPLRARAAEAALLGRKLDESTLEGTVAALLSEVELRTSPHRATAEYRRHLLRMLLRRTLLGAERRLRSAGNADSNRAGPEPDPR